MAYYTYTKDPIGCFVERDTGNYFEYSDIGDDPMTPRDHTRSPLRPLLCDQRSHQARRVLSRRPQGRVHSIQQAQELFNSLSQVRSGGNRIKQPLEVDKELFDAIMKA